MSGDPFKTPQLATLMEVHRERSEGPGAAATSMSLSQLLANREKRRGSQTLGLGSSGKLAALKNSREHHSCHVSILQSRLAVKIIMEQNKLGFIFPLVYNAALLVSANAGG